MEETLALRFLSMLAVDQVIFFFLVLKHLQEKRKRLWNGAGLLLKLSLHPQR